MAPNSKNHTGRSDGSSALKRCVNVTSHSFNGFHMMYRVSLCYQYRPRVNIILFDELHRREQRTGSWHLHASAMLEMHQNPGEFIKVKE